MFLLLLPLSVALLPSGDSADWTVTFQDVTRQAGIQWTHRNGATADKYLIETMGGGGAFLDYDRDGFLDLFLVDSGPHAHSPSAAANRNALYRNSGDGTFTDVTEQAGLAGKGYGHGVAVGDFDNDGWSDIYVTGYGANTLYRNRGDGRFEDVTERSGTAVGLWSTSAAFFDLENDGDLDLFVCVYLEWDYEKNVWCGERRDGFRSYCHPDYFKPIPSLLFRNDGNGTFTDITRRAGAGKPGKALGVVAGDIDGDGFADLYVANDAVANFLFHNRGDGTFEEVGLLAEVAYGISAKPESGMGTDLGDFNGDGRLDLIVTNIDYEMNNLYVNDGDTLFSDVTVVSGLGQAALLFSGFGVRFVDVDNDGDLDLVVLNGHPLDNIELYRNGVTSSEPPMIFRNDGGRFKPIMEQAGEVWKRSFQGRALAQGDYDNDGDADLLFVNNGQPAVLLRNDGGNRNPWLGIRLQGTVSNRDAVGAEVKVKTSSRQLVRQVLGGGSYQAAHDLRLVFGFLPEEAVESVTVRWPNGRVQRLDSLELRRYHTIVEPME